MPVVWIQATCGSVNNNIGNISTLAPTNLRKGGFVQFGAIHCSHPFNKFRSVYALNASLEISETVWGFSESNPQIFREQPFGC